MDEEVITTCCNAQSHVSILYITNVVDVTVRLLLTVFITVKHIYLKILKHFGGGLCGIFGRLIFFPNADQTVTMSISSKVIQKFTY